MLVSAFSLQPLSPSLSKMQLVSTGHSLWISTLLLASAPLWGRLSASTSPPGLPAPELSIYSRSKGTVVLTCRAPPGQRGVLFMLSQRNKRGSQEVQTDSVEVRFTVSVLPADSAQVELYCCLYKSKEGHFSAYSPYLTIERQNEPTQSPPALPPPVLSVQPSSGVVTHGDVLSFQCSMPFLPMQSQLQPRKDNSRPTAFFLLRTDEGTGVASAVPQNPARQMSDAHPQPGVFSVGPVEGEEAGEYSCFYQITKKRGLVNSTVSNKVQVFITDLLPTPTLVLQRQEEVYHLLCVGSPSYPGAVFSLYLGADEHPITTRGVAAIHHQVTFPVPVQDASVGLYQCQYSVLLGKKWSHSSRSVPLVLTKGFLPQTPSEKADVDWPLVLGSFSAVMLVLCSVVVVTVVVHRKAKAAAKERKQRQDAKFWSRFQAKDAEDLTIRPGSSTCQEWETETATRAPLWNSLSTFTGPMQPVH